MPKHTLLNICFERPNMSIPLDLWHVVTTQLSFFNKNIKLKSLNKTLHKHMKINQLAVKCDERFGMIIEKYPQINNILVCSRDEEVPMEKIYPDLNSNIRQIFSRVKRLVLEGKINIDILPMFPNLVNLEMSKAQFLYEVYPTHLDLKKLKSLVITQDCQYHQCARSLEQLDLTHLRVASGMCFSFININSYKNLKHLDYSLNGNKYEQTFLCELFNLEVLLITVTGYIQINNLNHLTKLKKIVINAQKGIMEGDCIANLNLEHLEAAKVSFEGAINLNKLKYFLTLKYKLFIHNDGTKSIVLLNNPMFVQYGMCGVLDYTSLYYGIGRRLATKQTSDRPRTNHPRLVDLADANASLEGSVPQLTINQKASIKDLKKKVKYTLPKALFPKNSKQRYKKTSYHGR